MRLAVVRFHTTGCREHHELALLVPLCDERVRVIYRDGEVECEASMLCKSSSVTVQVMLEKAHVRAAVQKQHVELRAKLADAHPQVRQAPTHHCPMLSTS